MTNWGRDSFWRQGCVVSVEALCEHFDLETEHGFAMCISHDCDIASDSNKEPFVEFIYANCIQQTDAQKQNARNPRTLQLNLNLFSEETQVEMLAHNKFTLDKELLAGFHSDNVEYIQQDEKDILRSWLAARYRRHAFPDELTNRIAPLLTELEKQAKRFPKNVVGILINYDPFDTELENDEDVYEIELSIIYSCEQTDAKENAEAIATRVKSRFDDGTRFRGNVYLEDCKVFSETEFTLYQLRKNIHIRFEYISYREGEQFEEPEL